MPGNNRRCLELMVTRKRADANILLGLSNEGQASDPVDVDEDRRP